MGLVQPADPDLLTLAESLVSAHLGAVSLEARPVTEVGQLGSSGMIWLAQGPAVSLQSLTLGGASAVGVLASPWSVQVGAPYAGFAFAVTYTAGWTAETLPEPIRQAVLLTAQDLTARPAGIKSESMGPTSTTYADAGPGGLPAAAANLLAPWRALRF